MKIGIFSDTYSPQINGVVTSIKTYEKALRGFGHEVYIIAPRMNNLPQVESDSPNVFRFWSFTFPSYQEHRFSLPFPSSLCEKILSLNLDIIHIQTPFGMGYLGMKIAKSKDIPIVHTYHTLFSHYVHYVPFLPRKIAVNMAFSVSRRTCNFCDLVIAPSTAMRDTLLSYGVTKRIIVLPTGIPIEEFHVREIEKTTEIFKNEKEKPFIFFASRLGMEKNIHFLIRVYKRILSVIPDIYFLIAGEGPAKAEIMEYIKSLGLEGKVKFAGYLKRQELLNLCYLSKVFVFSSVTETQGLVLLESMAMGTPVVAVDAMGVSDILRGDFGGFLVPQDEEVFAERVISLIKDSSLHQRKSKEALVRAKKFSIDILAKKLEEEYILLKNYKESKVRIQGVKWKS